MNRTKVTDNGLMADTERDRLVAGLTRHLEGRPEVLDAYLFGSRARGTAQSHSDIDVAVFIDHELAPESPYGYLAELTAALAAAVNNDTVDVVVLNDAPPLLYHRVLRDGIRLLSRNLSATTTREGRALSRYCDFVPQLRKIEAAHRARVEAGHLGR